MFNIYQLIILKVLSENEPLTLIKSLALQRIYEN